MKKEMFYFAFWLCFYLLTSSLFFYKAFLANRLLNGLTGIDYFNNSIFASSFACFLLYVIPIGFILWVYYDEIKNKHGQK